MASCYDDAVSLYNKYKSNILGVISDVGFVLHKGDNPRTEKRDAGIDLCRMVKADSPTMPFLMQSSQASMKDLADELGVGFVLKSSKSLTQDLGDYIGREFGFGDFIVTDRDNGPVLARARDLFEFEQVMSGISDEALKYLSSKNYISRWLLGRGLFKIGSMFRPIRIESDDDIDDKAAHRLGR